MSRPRVCFFAKVRSRDELRKVEFYAQDLRVLEDLGFEVHIAIRPWELRPADLYFVWWWTWAFVPVAYAAALRRPVIVTGVFDYWKFDQRPAAHRWLHRYALRAAAANVFISEMEYRQVPAVTRVRNPRYIPLTVDGSLYHPGGERRPDLVFTMATMTGGNGERKCVRELIEAAAVVRRSRPDVRFVIAGEIDPLYPALAASLGIGDRVEFPGAIGREQKIDHMQRCTVYLQPSRFEGFGLAIAEALACGAPVVTSPVGAVPEVVGPAARFVDGTSPDRIAEGVLALLDDPRGRADLSRLGHERIGQQLSCERHRREWAAVIDEIL